MAPPLPLRRQATVLILVSLCVVKASQTERVLSLLNDSYDVNENPHFGTGKPTVVNVQMFLNSFGSLNAAHMDFTIDMFLRQEWQDPRLAYSNGLDRYTIMDPNLQKKIWRPDTFFENVKSAHVHAVSMPNIMLRVYKTGDVMYSMRVTLTLSCNLELALYPFDAQKCYVMIASYANTEDVITYRWKTDPPIDFNEGIQISQFDLLSNTTYSHRNVYSTGNFSGLTGEFRLRRQNGYHVLQTYVPTILIVSISWVSFWLDPNAVPGRISLGVTTLLTLTTLAAGIRQSLPPVSYVKAIDVWIGMCMIMVYGALLEFTLVNWMANKKMVNSLLPGRINLPSWSTNKKKGTKMELVTVVPLVGSTPTEEDSKQQEQPEVTYQPQPNISIENTGIEIRGEGATYMYYARATDRFCRALFPGGFLVFNLIYWPYYIIQQRLVL